VGGTRAPVGTSDRHSQAPSGDAPNSLGRGREGEGRRGRRTRAPAPNSDTPKSTLGRMFIQDMSTPRYSKIDGKVKEGGEPKRIFNLQGESRRVGHRKPREKVRIFSRVINEVNALKAQDSQVHQAPFVRVKISKKNVWALGLLDTGNTTKNSLISEEFFNICEGVYKHANQIRLNTAAQGGGLTVLGQMQPFKMFLEGVKTPVVLSPWVVRNLTHPNLRFKLSSGERVCTGNDSSI